MNCKPGCLAFVVNGGAYPEYAGRILTCVSVVQPSQIDCLPGETQPHWRTDPQLRADGGAVICWADVSLRKIGDQPGDEQFVVESRKSLPRKKPVTGPVTINERGEVA